METLPKPKLLGLYNISDFIPVGLTLSIQDYKTIHDDKSSIGIQSFFFEIPKQLIPKKYLDSALLIDSFFKSALFLRNVEKIPSSDGSYYNYITLFDLITKYGKVPITKNLSNKSINLAHEVDNYYKNTILHRFFTNKGTVFYSELLPVHSVPTIVTDAFSNSKINYYDQLIDDGILRKATPNDLPTILKYQNKKQILTVINQIYSKQQLKSFEINSLNKENLILLISQNPIIVDIGIHNHFYLLTDKVQEFKNWIFLEKLYHSVYNVFDTPLSETGHKIPMVMKELITNNKDYETASKLGLIYYKHLNDFKTNPRFYEHFETPRVELQLRNIERHYKSTK